MRSKRAGLAETAARLNADDERHHLFEHRSFNIPADPTGILDGQMYRMMGMLWDELYVSTFSDTRFF